ncbi:hypothetical protein [Erwinia psidii]|nr:hypothetical protein [Erwinia psidii]MCX8963521.1 hypothetical protein [Erwinia psidii]
MTSLTAPSLRLSVSHFITPLIQLQLSAGRDLTVELGFRLDTRLSFRAGFLFKPFRPSSTLAWSPGYPVGPERLIWC